MNTIEKLGKMLRAKKISARELTELYLKAARSTGSDINAFISITDEAAYSAAADVDAAIAQGTDIHALAGMPFVLKDNIATKGMKTTCASRMLENHVPVYDATVWRLLRGAGAVPVGKGNMDEFAMGATGETSYFGGTINPHNPDCTAGGSSGGVAAAVAGSCAVYGIGSDTGGSIRQPAALCGVVGLKPTYGAVSRRGLIAYASSLDQIGPIALTVRDTALIYDTICKPDDRDMTCTGGKTVAERLDGGVRGMKIGIASEFFENLPAGVAQAVDNALETYKKLGAELVDVKFPLLKHSLGAYYVLACAEASSNLNRYDGLRYGYRPEGEFSDMDEFVKRTRSEGFGAEVRRRILLGTCVLSTGYYDAYYNKALMLKNAISNDYTKIFDKCDFLVSPTLPVSSIPRGAGQCLETYQSDILTVSVNIAGLPAVSVPCGFDGVNPIGMQLIGGVLREDVILGAAQAFETKTAGCYIKTRESGVEL